MNPADEHDFTFSDGIPSIEDYRRLLQSGLFRDVERYSDEFLARHRFLEQQYRWNKDPFHQWSRQWEYPYVLQKVAQQVAHARRTGAGSVKVLDAGSGITFFPFLLTQRYPECEIVCSDVDAGLASLYRQVTATERDAGRIRFLPADLARLPFENGHFDVIYSVSVLEHTSDPVAIVGELSRLLRPGGTLVLSFDIGLDGVSTLDRVEAQRLLDFLGQRFGVSVTNLGEVLARRDIATSSRIAQMNAKLLPWASPFLSLVLTSLRRRRVPRRLRKRLAFCCGSFQASR